MNGNINKTTVRIIKVTIQVSKMLNIYTIHCSNPRDIDNKDTLW